MPKELNEKCGIFGVFDVHAANTIHLVRLGLNSLQHRGQESCGIATSDFKKITSHTGLGLVMQVFNNEFDVNKLPGGIAIGHTRYPTSSVKLDRNAHQQPCTGSGKKKLLALAHNGNIPDTQQLEKFMVKNSIPNNGYNDSEQMHAIIEHFMKKGATLEDAVIQSAPVFNGAFSLVMISENQLVAMRDPYGLRPLSIGKLNGCYFVSSETCTFELLGAEYIRDVQPGEIVVIDENGMRSHEFAKGQQRLDVFEFVYFARPDSKLLGKNVGIARSNMGKILAKEMLKKEKIEADMVIGVPDSGSPSGYGFAQESGLPHEQGFVRNRYVGRTFQMQQQATREQMVRMKLNPMRDIVCGKSVLLVDDSIVRGTTSRAIAKMVRDSGAKKIHLAVTSPPVRYPDFYGIDTPRQEGLLAFKYRTAKEMARAISVDSLTFLSLEGMIEAIGVPKELLSTSAFTGEYPVDIGKHKSEITNLGKYLG